MKSSRRHVARRGIRRCALLLAIMGLGLIAPTAPVASRPAAPDSDAVAGIRPETRLRKLHLVRPDLIPYPIAYEVYC
jgi:hypothetical protein